MYAPCNSSYNFVLQTTCVGIAPSPCGTRSGMEDGTNTSWKSKTRCRSRVRAARIVAEHERNLELEYPNDPGYFEHV
jgi:hypothetical protein